MTAGQPQKDNLYRITRWDLEEYYDAIAHINGKSEADRMWDRIERNTRSRPAPEQCPHWGIEHSDGMEWVCNRPAPAGDTTYCRGVGIVPGSTTPKTGLEQHDAAIRKEERVKAIKLFDEVKAGIKAYESEHKTHQAKDDCCGIYIPVNVVRRLIDKRVESLRHEEVR